MPPGTPLRNVATPSPGYGPLPRSRPRVVLIDESVTATRYADSIARRGRAVAMTLLAAIQRPTQKAMECQCCARVTHAGLQVGGKPLEAWLAFACTVHAAGLVAPREPSTAGYWLRWPRYTTMPR